MSDWAPGVLADAITSLDAGVSVNAEDRPHGAGEIGVLKTSAISGGRFLRHQNKAVLQHERPLVAEPVQADSILLSRMNTPALVGESCYVADAHPSLFLPDRIWQLKPKDRTKLSMRWLSFVLQSAEYRRYVEVHATGTSGSMKNLPKSKLMALPLLYPSPKEQAGIAQVLDTLDTAIRETEAIIAKLKAVKQGLLHDLLTRGVDANGELRPPQSEAPHLYKQSPLGWVPQSWTWSRVGDLLSEPPRNGLYKPPHLIGSGALLVGQTAFTDDGSVRFDLARRAQVSGGERSAFGLCSGDVLVSRVYATLEGVGQPVIVPELPEGAVYESNMMRLRVRQGAIKSTVLFALLRQPQVRAAVRSRASLSNQASINRNGLCSIFLPIPSWGEQELIDERMAILALRLRRETDALDKRKAARNGLMDDLLTGRVRVTPLLESAEATPA